MGLALAVSSSVFIGSSFIIKKRGLRVAGASGLRAGGCVRHARCAEPATASATQTPSGGGDDTREHPGPRPSHAGAGGFSYLREPIWWAGLLSMVVGELANFAAYAFAPAVLVTPLGALSIIVRWRRCWRAGGSCKHALTAFGLSQPDGMADVSSCLILIRMHPHPDVLCHAVPCNSAVLAHIFLKEHLNLFGILGCILCITGSVTIVLHVPAERPIESVAQVWNLAMQPGASRAVVPAWCAHMCTCVLPPGLACPPAALPASAVPALSHTPGFLLYSAVALGLIMWLIFWVSPVHGSDNVLVYLAICSLAGSFTVSCCKVCAHGWLQGLGLSFAAAVAVLPRVR